MAEPRSPAATLFGERPEYSGFASQATEMPASLAWDVANGGSLQPVFSPDGTKVALRSLASNLVAGGTNGTSGIFVATLPQAAALDGGDGDDTLVGSDGTETRDSIAVSAVANTGSATHVVLAGMSIQAAIDAAAAGDTVIVRPGSYTEIVTIDKALVHVNRARRRDSARREQAAPRFRSGADPPERGETPHRGERERAAPQRSRQGRR